MQIVCPNCAISYEVQADALGGSERPVRCARCRTVWIAGPAVPATEMSDGPANAEATFRADPSSTGPGSVPFYEAMHPDGATGEAPTKKEERIERTEWADVRAEQALAHAAEQQVAVQAEALPGSDDGLSAGLDHAPDDVLTNTIDDDEAPPLAPDLADEKPPTWERTKTARKRPEDIESFAGRRARRAALRRQHNWLKPSLPNAIIVLVAIVSVLIGWRSDVVRLMPQTASFFSSIGLGVNLRGLSFADVKISRTQHDGVNVLVVEGKIVSEVPKPIVVPGLRFAVRNAAGHEVYAWTALPTRSILPAGESLPFRGRLASPPPDTRTVLVRFFNRRDIVAGER